MCAYALLYVSITALSSGLFEQPDKTEELKIIRREKNEKHCWKP